LKEVPKSKSTKKEELNLNNSESNQHPFSDPNELSCIVKIYEDSETLKKDS